jgi:hypothetical protein
MTAEGGEGDEEKLGSEVEENSGGFRPRSHHHFDEKFLFLIKVVFADFAPGLMEWLKLGYENYCGLSFES